MPVLVSVVIPFRDPQEQFFREAVASVIAQDYRPLELVLANDGSARPAVELARQLMASSGLPALLVEHPGGVSKGTSATRNRGASAAKGELLAFLDADDVWSPEKVREQVEILTHGPAIALVFGQTRYWYSWRRTRDADFVVQRGIERDTIFEPPQFVASFLRGRVIVPSTSNTMMRRRAFEACGGFEESFSGMYDDQAFLVKLGLANLIGGVARCWDRYRQHDTSMTALAGQCGTELEFRRHFLSWIPAYCLRNGIDCPEVIEAASKEMWLAAGAHRSRLLNRMRRGWLRLEEGVLPKAVRRRIWCRPGQ